MRYRTALLALLAATACGREPGAWAEDLRTGDAFERRLAALALRELEGAELERTVRPAMFAALDPDARVRSAVLESWIRLRDAGRLGDGAAGPVLQALESEDPAVRRLGARTLVAFSPSERVWGAARRALDDPNPLVRAEAFSTLCVLEPGDGRRRRFLLEIAEDPTSLFRERAVRRLEKLD